MPETERLKLHECYEEDPAFFDFIRPEQDWSKVEDADREPPGPECCVCQLHADMSYKNAMAQCDCHLCDCPETKEPALH